MTRIFPSATLRHMALRKRLTSHVAPLVLSESDDENLILQLAATKDGMETHHFPYVVIENLVDEHMATLSETKKPRPGLPFAFVQAINFELTYGCNIACSHCLQSGLRTSGRMQWINKDAAKQAIRDAAWLGVTKNAINLTGGEIYLPGSPVLELIDEAASAGLQIRSNTNGWWGGRTNFTVDNEQFRSDKDLIRSLKDRGLTVLVMSLDARYQQYPDLADRVLTIVSICEEMELLYEFVASDVSDETLQLAQQTLHDKLGHPPQYLLFSPMEVVDIGAAASNCSTSLDTKNLAGLATQTPCGGRGFHRPYYLHVMPDGGVRSCLYAPGAGYLGNICQQRLPRILNGMEGHGVTRMFKEESLEQFVTNSVRPWQHLYKGVTHPCAASALMARASGELLSTQKGLGRNLTDEEEESLHLRLAAEYNLSAD